jgi:hypothetical protein
MVKKKAKVVLSFDDRNKIAAFFAILIKVEKCMRAATSDKKTKKAKSKKNQKTKPRDRGSPIRGPFFIFGKKTQIKFINSKRKAYQSRLSSKT